MATTASIATTKIPVVKPEIAEHGSDDVSGSDSDLHSWTDAGVHDAAVIARVDQQQLHAEDGRQQNPSNDDNNKDKDGPKKQMSTLNVQLETPSLNKTHNTRQREQNIKLINEKANQSNRPSSAALIVAKNRKMLISPSSAESLPPSRRKRHKHPPSSTTLTTYKREKPTTSCQAGNYDYRPSFEEGTYGLLKHYLK
jgi:hypothetical protein